MDIIKIRYTFRHKGSGNIEMKWYSIGQLEERAAAKLSPVFSDEYELISRDLYTGLKDKNGREIYEGDIIVYEIDNGIGVERYCGKVFWSENEGEYKTCFGWLIEYVNTVGFDGLSRAAIYNDELEVVGNIYKNPELFEASHASK
ncbi:MULTISPECIES: YopX family protein [Bacillus]|uniref:YopX family protein n=1 Tax=Bacillus TaxID=1386 RepID=UPI001B97DD90|nr:YopX family protein [Bacillus subtilis]MEC3693658.1 YopX family protein [Bacillus subtilis]CAF1878067.1 hypothetical protein NRS6181_04385 [Bacillus subtilis]CAI6293840.1 YopX domain-containing protein [Bacillus subtilis]